MSSLSNILLDRLDTSGSALKWFKSYFQDGDYSVSIANYESEHMQITCGDPQGSIVGPVLFNICTLLMATMMELLMSSLLKWEIRGWI